VAENTFVLRHSLLTVLEFGFCVSTRRMTLIYCTYRLLSKLALMKIYLSPARYAQEQSMDINI
jgi:hypothetical protein